MTSQKSHYHLIITVASRDEMPGKFRKKVYSLKPNALVEVNGISDVALARNAQLTDTEQVWEDNSVILMLDDDIDISTSEAALDIYELISRAITSGRPTSALYVDRDGKPTCSPFPDKPGKWLAGLGVMAIPVQCLRDLKKLSVETSARGKRITCYTASKPMNINNKWEWSSEDYTLCMYLGGVNLEPDLRFGHRKMLPIFPSDSMSRKLSEMNNNCSILSGGDE